jgi:hypothetical protein
VTTIVTLKAMMPPFAQVKLEAERAVKMKIWMQDFVSHDAACHQILVD